MPTEHEQVKALFERLDQAPLHAFPSPRESIEAPATHGVYAVVAPDRIRVLHVGRTVTGQRGLKHRLTNHLRGRSSFARLHLDGDPTTVRDCWFKYVEVADARIRALLEAYAIGQYCPAHIGIAQSVLDAQEARRNAT